MTGLLLLSPTVPLPLKLSGELGFLSSFVEHVHSTEDRLCNLFF